MIEQVGQVLSGSSLSPAYGVDDSVANLAEILTGRIPRSVLLIGPSGSGKTAIVHQLVKQRSAHKMSETPVWTTSGARLIAGMSGFGMWQQRCQTLCKEASRVKAILHVGSLIELMQVGRVGGSTGIAGFLRSYLNRGDLLVIAECTTEQLSAIERLDPHLLELFHQLKIEEPDALTGRKILAAVASSAGQITDNESPWLVALDRLHRRYATYSAYPGRPVRFLQNLLKDQTDGAAPTSGDVITAFSRETGLPRFMLDAEVPLDLAAAHDWFTSRLIGQPRAVELVADLLATMKAALSRPRRPIASLLFIGPTGVGKTEMAKALAEYFFGDRARLTRFDMSEFASPSAIERLIGSAYGPEGLLTAKVREQPFSVILFDEFEKAHAGFFDLLLQVLGEGRLTDAAGRAGDFLNTIVIMTSNLGAQSFGQGSFGLSRARGNGHPEAEQHFTDEVRAFVRPELFNRIDRIVPFMPLEDEAIGQIAHRELQQVKQRDGVRLRGIDLSVSPAAVKRLVANGYDVRYGARPLKRSIERDLLAPLADAINGYASTTRLEAEADLQDGLLTVQVRATPENTDANSPSVLLDKAANQIATFRRDVQKCERCTAILTVTNQLFRLKREQQRKEARAKAKNKTYYDAALSLKIKTLRAITDELEEISQAVQFMEDAVLTAFYSADGIEVPAVHHELPALIDRFDLLLLNLLTSRSGQDREVVFGVLGPRKQVVDLVAIYMQIARKHSYKVNAFWYSPHSRDEFQRHRINNIDDFLKDPDESLSGIGLAFSGLFAPLRFGRERGIHGFDIAQRTECVLVEIADCALTRYIPAKIKDWPVQVTAAQARRMYHLAAGSIQDQLLDAELRWTGRDYSSVVELAIERQLRLAARAVMQS